MTLGEDPESNEGGRLRAMILMRVLGMGVEEMGVAPATVISHYDGRQESTTYNKRMPRIR